MDGRRSEVRQQRRSAASSSSKISIDADLRRAYLAARLAALEEDNPRGRGGKEEEEDDDDEEYVFDSDDVMSSDDDISDDDDDGDALARKGPKGKAKKAKKAKKGKKTTRAGAGADGGVKKRRGQKRKTGDASAKRNVPTLLKPRYENFEDLLRSTDDDARRRYEGAASFTNTPLPGRSLCELTGLEARYTHPTTKMRFHGRREFRQIEDMPTLAVQAKMTRML